MAVNVVSYGGDGQPGAPGANGAPGSAGAATLDGATAIGATSITLDALPPTLTDGAVVAIDGGSNKCELRRVDGIASLTLTLNSALKIAHSDNVNVWVVDSFWVPPEWWGATSDDSTDSYRSLINMFLDQDPLLYGIQGRGTGGTAGKYYGSSRPLFITDKGQVRIGLRAFNPFGIDPMIGTWTDDSGLAIPNQYFLYGAGQQVTATFDATTNEVTISGSIGTQGSDVVFYPRQGSTMAGGVEEGRRYFMPQDAASTTTFKLVQNNEGVNADAIDITSNGSGEIVAISTGLSRINNGHLALNGNTIQGLNGFLHLTQQPSNVEARIENFPVVGATIGGQQGYMPNLMVFNCWRGLEVSCVVNFFPGLNCELNDENLIFSDTDRHPQGSGGNWTVGIAGAHFENPGAGTSLVQTLIPSATLASGTFKLRFKNVKTGFINYNATAAQLQTELEAHAAIGAGNVTCTQITGTNLSDGRIKIDFSVGTLNWSRFSGSTDTRFGGEVAVTDSTLTGGTLSVNTTRPTGRNISFKYGKTCHITNALTSSVPVQGDGTTRPYFIQFEGTAIDSSAGNNHGISLHDVMPYNQQPFVLDSLHGIDISAADSTVDGVSESCVRYVRPTRHGGQIGRHDWWSGAGTRRIVRSTKGAAMEEYQSESGQTDAMVSYKNSSGTEGFKIDRDGLPMILAGSKTHDWPSLANGSTDSTTVTVTGAAVGDFAMASMSVAPPAGLVYHAQVTASNTVTVTRINNSGSAHDPASGTLRATIIQPI